jgi:hypothetical protein
MGRRVMYRIASLNEWVNHQEQADSRSNPAISPLSRPARHRSRAGW